MPVSTHIATAGQSASQGSSSILASTPPAVRGHHPPLNTNYDEQVGITFTQNFTSLEYNVTAVEQIDPTLGTGPGYRLRARSNLGYWYQVGVSWDWSPGIGFAMSYEVFDSVGNSIFPTDGGGGLLAFSGPVNAGDNVNLHLYFSSGQVVMVAEDVETGANAQVTYTAVGGTEFVGQPNGDATSIGFFTGLMSEWYHGEPYYANLQEVNYTSDVPISSAWMWMDEFNANNGQLVFASNATALSTFSANPTQLQEFSYGSITEYADALEFITGAPSNSTTTTTSTVSPTESATATSTVTITAASTETVTTIVPITITQTATTTLIQPVATTVTTTTTATSTAPPSTTTTTLTTTQTAAASGALPPWSYVLMAVLLAAGLAVGYLIKRSAVGTPQSAAGEVPG
jgi:hypothetical protein